MGDMILYRSTNGFGADLTNYKVMTVVINEADSNPATCCSYADDAVNMQSGASANAQWQEFFGYKPCLFKNGQVVGYLNPNDYSKFENGGTADITSGNAGDVMIEFPRRGIRCVKDGTTIRISMTDAPNDPEFKYYAHQRGTVSKDAFYIGAYVGTFADGNTDNTNTSKKIRSLSGQKMARYNAEGNATQYEKNHNTKRTQCQNNGDGYESFPYVLMIFLQVMYVLQFKNLNSVDNLGVRFISGQYSSIGSGDEYYGYADYLTGSTNSAGLFLKNAYTTNTSAYTDSTKTFGMEDLLAFCYMHDGFVFGPMTPNDGNDTRYVALLALGIDVYNESFDTYTVVFDSTEHEVPSSSADKISECAGITECPFFPLATNGSSTTYYCGTGSLTKYDQSYSRVTSCRTIYQSTYSYYAYTSIFTLTDMHDRDSLCTTRLCYI